MIIYIAHCQYTCSAWIDRLKQHNIIISMDGKGRRADKFFSRVDFLLPIAGVFSVK